jgi:hypothetical protein
MSEVEAMGLPGTVGRRGTWKSGSLPDVVQYHGARVNLQRLRSAGRERRRRRSERK